MGDRNNPIKFGPEWLRNLSREPSAGGSGPNNQNNPPWTNNTSGPPGPGSGPMIGQNYGTVASPNSGTSANQNSGSGVNATAGQTGSSSPVAPFSSGGAGTGAGSGSPLPGPSSGVIPRSRTNNPVPKILLAKLRYGREEMLALYDRYLESPEELKNFDILYQPRAKPPFALNNTFDEDIRDNVRSGPPVGAIPIPERYSSSRGGIGRGGNISEARGKSRMPFVRQTILGGRRQNNNTNWRQPHVRDENEEWRFPETQRNRPPADKWDREWGERPNQERQQSWNSNRRTWVGNENLNNEDNLPEWAVDNAEAGAGTFDSSGAFHGYSNDDTNLPKSQETSFPLARSQTHGSFSRSKTAEEGMDEWWASEKAKKLSGKKFDTADSNFIKAGSSGSVEGNNTNSKQSAGREDDAYDEISEREEKIEPPKSPEGDDSNAEDTNQNNIFTNQFQESKAFEALMRSDIELDNTNNERSNFQSVMITPNHGLRQKHQNLVPCQVDSTGRQHLNTGLLQMLHVLPPMNPAPDNENRETPDDKLVEKILDMTLEDPKLQNPMMVPMHPNMNPGMPNQMANNLQLQIGNQVLPNHGMPVKGAPLQMANLQGQMQPMHNVGVPNQMNPPIQNVGMHNSALNSSLGLTIGTPNNNLVMPMQGVPPSVMPNPGIQARLGFQPSGRMPMMPGANVGNTSLFMGQNNQPLMPSNEIQMPNANPQNNMYPMHALQHSQGSQGPFSSMYNLPQAATPITPDANLVDAWYYEDPEKVIQGPFSSKEMYNWYRAGFFTPSLMVRRACEAHLRPLGSYGPVVPFIQIDMLPTYPMSTAYDTHPQQPMGVDDSLWSQPAPSADMIWMQQMNNRNESRVNNLPMFFWDSQAASAISSNALLPEEIAKEMKTEDQILAQLRASQNLPPAPQATTFMNDQPPTSTANAPATFNKPEETFQTNVSATPNLEELQKLIQPEALSPPTAFSQPDPEPDKKSESQEVEVPEVQEIKEEPVPMEPSPPAPAPEPAPKQQQPQRKVSPEPKLPKQTKNDSEKVVNKIKENNNAKTKNKKAKEEKKEEVPEIKTKEDDVPVRAEKRSVESSPTKSKKEEKQNKKEQEKEKKELIKNGFTIVKGVEKPSKENKKKAEEAKVNAAAAEEADRKKKKEEETAVEEEKKRKIADAIKKAQEQQQQRQESIAKKAPWSSLSTQSIASAQEQGLTLAEIQRLEREKKVEQIKEQQQMMQIIAQQQAAAMAREQEMQAGLGWAKKKSSNVNVSGQKLADIQAETRKAAAAVAAAAATAAAAAAKALDDSLPQASAQVPAPAVTVPWASSQNGGFWETQTTVPSKTEKASEITKATDFNKPKKKVTLSITKKDTTPAVEFEAWCTNILTPWNSKIDVPTFIGFLKDIESPYEVKDYVKCYLGETKDSSDFARQFLERRSKLLRVGMVTPSDDLCSPALAINPRNTNLGDYQEIKGKGKKAKKNKMLKVDARILGFSVTASEDRINVGDIDTV